MVGATKSIANEHRCKCRVVYQSQTRNVCNNGGCDVLGDFFTRKISQNFLCAARSVGEEANGSSASQIRLFGPFEVSALIFGDLISFSKA